MTDTLNTEPIPTVREALAELVALHPLDGESRNDCFERVALRFRAATGYLAPGKDCRLHDPEVREAAHDEWMAALIRNARAALDAAPAPAKPAQAAHIAWLHYCLRESGMCIDGGTCSHACDPKGECFRSTCCVPLTGSALTDDWTIAAPPAAAPVQPLSDQEAAGAALEKMLDVPGIYVMAMPIGLICLEVDIDRNCHQLKPRSLERDGLLVRAYWRTESIDAIAGPFARKVQPLSDEQIENCIDAANRKFNSRRRPRRAHDRRQRMTDANA